MLCPCPEAVVDMNEGRACREGEGGAATLVGRSGFQLPREARGPEKTPQEGMWYICPLCSTHITHPDVLSSSAGGSVWPCFGP